ncbi:ImuA family protein [Parvularcula dongshanensis]|uniref:Protein ImuA n=1 Tax=Parvularcula dongshanensis TaxID=1173995 RepID=A0A840I2A0_9PROT|nr:damage-inducible protein [Parvularcula dongshanensis]MBB4658412.1 protein ImuA [Parvularcula dongshanensis]
MSRSQQIEALRAQIGVGSEVPKAVPLAFGAAPIDEALPGGGLALGSHELCPGGADLPHEAACVQLAAWLLGQARGPVVWVLPRLTLFPPALAEAGLSPSRVLFAEAGRDEDVLAVAEEALRHGGLAGVVCEASRLTLTASRRLQLAGEAGGVPCLTFRRWRRGQAPSVGTACATRWTVTALPSRAPSGLPRAAWRLALTRCRGGQPRSWDVALEPQSEPGTPLRLRLADAVAGRQAVPTARRFAA